VRCCQLSRRELPQWAVVVSSTSLLPVIGPERAYAAASARQISVDGVGDDGG
jgi:hypothetical protein